MLLPVHDLSFDLIRFQSQLATFRTCLLVANTAVFALQVADDFTEVSGFRGLGNAEVIEMVDTLTTYAIINLLNEDFKMG